jgi:5-methylthioadenosine/S-adenosylhomocysteine deaminase
VGLGTDGAASNNTLDILEQMRLAAMLQKHAQGDPRVLAVDEALALATCEGARALRQGDALGRLAPGYLADLILVRTDGVHAQPSHDLRATLVYSVRASDVDTVVVDGRVLMRGRQLLTVDADQALREVRARMARLAERAPGRRVQTYRT